jgi:preprotein translocase subunit SecG
LSCGGLKACCTNEFPGAEKKMSWLLNVVVMIQILAALVMIGLVLVQHGKGADMGASFGSGASGSLFGATGSANFLSRSTAVCAAVFFVCTLSLAYLSNERARPTSGTGSVLDRAPVTAPVASGPAQIPTGASPAVPAASAVIAPAASSVPAIPTK